MTKYEEYQLQWMVDHGYSLKDLMNLLAEVMNEELIVDGNAHIIIDEAFEIWEADCGFRGSIWVCEDEWEQNEALEEDEDDYTTIFKCATEMLEEKPYLNNWKHKDLIAMSVSEHCDEDEYIYYIEKEWLYSYVKTEFEIKDVDYWLQNEYTSDESENILFDGINAGVVTGIYR